MAKICTKNAKKHQKKEKNMEKITKDWTLGEVLEKNDDLAEILMGFGMHCFSCPMSQMETLEEACEVHGLDIDFVLQKLNEVE